MHRTEGDYNEDNLFQDGPPGTRVEAAWLNAVQEEIAHVIEDAGETLKIESTDTRDQLLAAILALINSQGFFYSTAIKTVNYTVNIADDGKLLLIDASGGNVTLALPTPTASLDGFAIGVKKTDNSANTVILDPSGAANIEGAGTFTLRLQNGTAIAICNGTEYYLVSLNEITNAMCAASLKDPAAAVAGLRTLGFGAAQAMPGDMNDALIKAWVNFNGTGVVAISDSYNVTSVIDNGVGDYTIVWDTDFVDTSYCYWGTVRDNESIISPAGDLFLGVPFGGTKTVEALQVMVCTAAATQVDSPEVCVAAIGDQ